ncbi:DNA-binding protein YbaB [Thermocatellispora tengchongensis]|uniref:DNA-binding protein YbaB n=1 Tax=Thermocatellispora tengchongensis TaxID=1073253 RepID=A0A840PF16_9ACTN|nr:YbaB/EbfC family nucleoid-associated protein [Thermocatellispora tengchongensis]MBB5138188.1 DNA-binding protein YbaB [Thermocatellispora tengchongensis]
MYDDVRAEDLERIARESEAAIARLGAAFTELDAVTGEGSGADGLARAVVDGSGGIIEITLEPRIMRLDSRSIAEAVTEAVRQAQQEARRRTEELVRAATGAADLSLDPEQIRRRFEELGESFTGLLDETARHADETARRYRM